MRVAISGTNGFIGSFLSKECIKQGLEVLGLCRNPRLPNEIAFDLNNPATFTQIPDVDAMIHTAYTTQAKDLKRAYQTNITGSVSLFDHCHTKNIRIIFLSSCSAHAQAESFYGHSKYQLEGHLHANDTIIRPGFVIGEGGIYQRLENSIRTLKFAPLFWGGQQPLQTIQLEDLVACIINAALHSHSGAYNLVHPIHHTLQEFYRKIFLKLSLTPRFLRLPGSLTLAGLKLAEFLKIPLPLTSENLIGLKYLKTFESDCERLGVNPKPF